MHTYRTQYHRMLEGELVRVAMEFDDLVPEAGPALIEELKARGKSDQEIWVLIDRGRKHRTHLSMVPGVDLELTRRVGDVVRTVTGFGRKFYGKANLVEN